MSLPPIDPGKIVWLAGPSSSGKTTSTRGLEQKGWIRVEADAEAAGIEVRFLKTGFIDKFAYFESHLTDLTTQEVVNVLYDQKRPGKEPADLKQFEKIRLELLDLLKECPISLNQATLIHMLDKAIHLASLGKSVILDHVPFINDPDFISHEVTIDKTAKNLWCYRDFKIEQQLKYVPVETLMRNVRGF